MKLWDKIGSLEFSEAEKDRIQKHLFDEKSLHHEILVSRAPNIREPDFWRQKQKRSRVTGFRDGHPKAIERVLSHTLTSVKKHPWRDANSAWPTLLSIYARTVQIYLHDELHSLSDLLRKEAYKESFGSLTEQIFRSIVRCLPLYEIEIGQVQRLYELWGFDRSDKIPEILASPYIDAEGARRIVDDRISTVRREIASAISASSGDVSQRLAQQQSELRTVAEAVTRLRSDFSERPIVPPTTSAIPGEAGDKHKQPSQVPRQIRRQDVETSTALHALQTRVESLGRQFKELKSHVEANGSATAVHPGKPPSEDDSSSTSTASALLARWGASFPHFGLSSPSVGAKWVVLELLRRSRNVVTDKPSLFTELYAALPGCHVKTITAAPHWVSAADWIDVQEFAAEKKAKPSLLVVLDFDVALQDTYLVPALSTLRATLQTESAHRILLVPSDTRLRSVAPRVFEFASFIPHDAPYIRDLGRIGGTILDAPPTLELSRTAAALLGHVNANLPSVEDELRRYVENVGVYLPTRVLENYINVYEGLRTSLSMRDAGLVSRESTLLPWVERARGPSLSRVVRDALESLEGT